MRKPHSSRTNLHRKARQEIERSENTGRDIEGDVRGKQFRDPLENPVPQVGNYAFPLLQPVEDEGPKSSPAYFIVNTDVPYKVAEDHSKGSSRHVRRKRATANVSTPLRLQAGATTAFCRTSTSRSSSTSNLTEGTIRSFRLPMKSLLMQRTSRETSPSSQMLCVA